MRLGRRKKRQDPCPIDPAMQAAWRHRIEQLEARLARDPEGEWAWLWQVRIQVLQFLLERSETDPARPTTSMPTPCIGDAPERAEHLVESTSPYDRPFEPQAQQRPQLSEQKRALLASLGQTNRIRRAIDNARRRWYLNGMDPDMRRYVIDKASAVLKSMRNERVIALRKQVAADMHLTVTEPQGIDEYDLLAYLIETNDDPGQGGASV